MDKNSKSVPNYENLPVYVPSNPQEAREYWDYLEKNGNEQGFKSQEMASVANNEGQYELQAQPKKTNKTPKSKLKTEKKAPPQYQRIENPQADGFGGEDIAIVVLISGLILFGLSKPRVGTAISISKQDDNRDLLSAMGVELSTDVANAADKNTVGLYYSSSKLKPLR